VDSDGESALHQLTSLPSASEDRIAKMRSYLDVFAEQGINGDMRKFNVEKVAAGIGEQGDHARDRLDKATRYAALFEETMSGAQRLDAVHRVAEDPGQS
jgi:hypothetical protein